VPSYETPKPISVLMDLAVGDIRVGAGERATTVVEVRPTDATQEADVRAAEQARVEYADGRLLVKASKHRGRGLFGRVGSIDVRVELPSGSELEVGAAAATLRSTGRLGRCRVKVAAGDVQLDRTGPVDLETGAGRVFVTLVAGDAVVSTGTGKIRLGEVGGSAVVKNSDGDNWIGQVRGPLRVRTANGDITVERAHSDVTAATANGDVQVGELIRGVVSLKTANGQIEVGIRPGSAARLDVHTSYGRVQNQLQGVEAPSASDERVEVRAQTAYGDIVVRRAPVPEPAASEGLK
jgi:DUF4097 and DUF4098 domain-containing protein YvlB